MHFVSKLNFFKIDKTLISLFYKSIIDSVISFCICAWGGNTAERDINKINRIARQATKITGISQCNFNDIFEKACFQKITRILKDSSHPFYNKITFRLGVIELYLSKLKKKDLKTLSCLLLSKFIALSNKD